MIKNDLLMKTGYVAIGLIILGVGVFILEKSNTTDIFGNRSNSDTASEAKTTSATPTAQADFSDGDFREPGTTLKENEGAGRIEDTRGDLQDVDTSTKSTSKTGEITVYEPSNNDAISSGKRVAGTSSLSSVRYRLIDSISGVISEGELQVVNGKFSGVISFETSANEGRLDFFGAREDSTEYSNVEIQLRFIK